MEKTHCESCHAGMPLLTAKALSQALVQLPGWEHQPEEKLIQKRFQFKGFYKTIAFVNAIAWIVQQEQHHPDMQVGYNYVLVQFQTHEAGGVTKNDIICAKRVEELMSE